jgi:hypothetical protein
VDAGASGLARRIGIETRADFMIGNQGEAEDAIKKQLILP